MRKVPILAIPMLVVLVLLIGMGAGTCGNVEEEGGTTAPPTPGEWTASTEFGELGLTVNPDSTGIAKVSFDFADFECGGSQVSGGVSVENPSLWSITDGRFTVDASIPLGEAVIDGEFDETGTHASGTWEINGCSGTWEASPGS